MAKKPAEEKDVLESTLSEIEKNFGEGIFTYGSDEIGNLKVIPFSVLSLNAITGIGGVPRGRVVEFHGMDGTFKTTFALDLIIECQKSGGTAALVDAEYAYLPEYGERLGVDNEKLIIIHPATAEEAFTVMEKLIDTRKVDIIVLDSIAALSPNAESQNDFGASNMGVMARLMGQMFRKLVAKIGKSNTAMIMINQLRENLGYVVTKTTPGGNALRFYASMRFEISKSLIKDKEGVKGVTLKVKCVKNKLAKPFLETELECIYGEGIDKLKDLLNMGIELGIIEKAGAGWMSYGDVRLQGLDNFKQLLLDNPELEQEIRQKITEKL